MANAPGWLVECCQTTKTGLFYYTTQQWHDEDDDDDDVSMST
jgi:hypothetical protein